jgi:PEP-CTERM motif
MKIVVPALAAVLLATIGASSAAQAARIDFAFNADDTSGVSASPEPLQDATSLNLDGSLLLATGFGAGDASGLALNDRIDVSPTDIMFGVVSAADPVIKSWTATIGPDVGDVFTETLTAVTAVDRSEKNSVSWTLTGTVSDEDGLFKGARVTMIIGATQAGGPGNVISVGGSNSTVVPEPSTWVMMLLGFAGLGYAAVRRSSKDRSALGI